MHRTADCTADCTVDDTMAQLRCLLSMSL